MRIQESAPLELLERAAILHEKRRNETLTEKEQEELILIGHQKNLPVWKMA